MRIKKHLRTYAAYRTLMKNQYLSRDQIRDIQERKLRRLVREAYNEVPYYRNLFDNAGITDRDINTLDDLRKIPVSTKAAMQGHENEFLLNQSIPIEKLESGATSGTSGRPFRVFFEPEYKYLKHAVFLRATKAAGYKFGEKLLQITRPGNPAIVKSSFRRRYVSCDDPQEEVLEILNTYKPDTLFSSVTPARRLAEFISDNQERFHKPKRIITAAERLDASTRQLMERTFRTKVFDHYGATEMSLIGWECHLHDGFHIDEDCKILEYLPAEGIADSTKLVLTNLELTAMPFIRFELGDIGIAGSESPCACGRTFARLKKVEGKIVDCISLEDGRVITPYSFLEKFEVIENLKRYQIKQKDYRDFSVLAEVDPVYASAVEDIIKSIMFSILGPEVSVSITILDNMIYPRNRKFRIVESSVGNETNIQS